MGNIPGYFGEVEGFQAKRLYSKNGLTDVQLYLDELAEMRGRNRMSKIII